MHEWWNEGYNEGELSIADDMFDRIRLYLFIGGTNVHLLQHHHIEYEQ